MCALVEYGSPIASLGEIAIETVCTTFADKCATAEARDVCRLGNCHDGCEFGCGGDSVCVNGECVCGEGYEGDPAAGCTGTTGDVSPGTAFATPRLHAYVLSDIVELGRQLYASPPYRVIC